MHCAWNGKAILHKSLPSHSLLFSFINLDFSPFPRPHDKSMIRSLHMHTCNLGPSFAMCSVLKAGSKARCRALFAYENSRAYIQRSSTKAGQSDDCFLRFHREDVHLGFQ